MNWGLGLMETVHEPTATSYGPSVLRQMFGRFPTGVVAVCGMDARSVPVGMVANSFTSVSLDPALISANFAQASKTWRILRHLDSLGISVLADHQQSACADLASSRQQDRFARVKWQEASIGSAVFIEEAMVWMHVRLVNEFRAGDHTVAIMQLQSMEVFPERRPLVFYRSQYHVLGLEGLNNTRQPQVAGVEAASILNIP